MSDILGSKVDSTANSISSLPHFPPPSHGSLRMQGKRISICRNDSWSVKVTWVQASEKQKQAGIGNKMI